MTHPMLRGTCNDTSCEFHGVCHEGCGDRTRVVVKADTKRAVVRFMPMMFRAGHSPQQRANMTGGWTYAIGESHRGDIPMDKVRSMLGMLCVTYGSQKAAASVLGIPARTFSCWLGTGRKGIRPESARMIVDAVLACKTPTDPWTQFDARRAPTEWERVKSRRYQEAEEQRSNRAKRAKRQEAS